MRLQFLVMVAQRLEDARKLVKRLFGKFNEGTARSDTYTPDDAKSKDFTFEELDAALKLLGISFDRKDRVGEQSTVKYTLKTKGLGGWKGTGNEQKGRRSSRK
jgi:hypothetical protein